MSVQVADELRSFHEFVAEKLSVGPSGLSPEEALDLWRTTNPDPDELQESVAAIREALNDIEAGDKGRPADEVVNDLRSRLQLPRK